MRRRLRLIVPVVGLACGVVAWPWIATAAPSGGTGAAPAHEAAKSPTAEKAAVAGGATAPAVGSPPPAPGAQAPPSGLDWLVKSIEAVQKFISGVLGSIGWALVVLAVLYVFRDQVIKLLQALTTAMEDRGVTLDIATVKVQVAERLNDLPDDRSTWYSRTPLEIDDDAAADPSILAQFKPQLEFQVTDSVAQYWSKRDGGAAAARAMRQAHGALATACAEGRAIDTVKTALSAFADRLEATRFLEARQFAVLIGQHVWLRDWLTRTEPKDLATHHADLLILHCAGVAYAQNSDWTSALAVTERIAWKDKVAPFYLPAGDTWLACAYHVLVQETQPNTADLDPDSAPDFFNKVYKLLAQGRQLLEAMDRSDWSSFIVARRHVGYYKRETQKVMALITSTLAEHAQDAAGAPDVAQAIEMLGRCVKPIDKDPPSPLDFNNLADLYRVKREWANAHTFIDQAFRPNEPPDPAFCHTRAMIFAQEREPARALRALDPYGKDDARRDGGANAEQYVDNQILAAKLTFSLGERAGTSYASLAVRILEDARRFLDDEQRRLGADALAKLRAGIDELLGFAYLQLPGFEDRAVEAFDRPRPPGEPAVSVPAWRRRLGRVLALTRLARAQRRDFSPEVAAPYWKRAHADLVDAANQVKPFGLEPTVSEPRRVRHLRLRLDTVVALRLVAEEGFAEGERQTARELLDHETPILVSVRTSLQRDPGVRARLGDERGALDALLRQVTVCEARQSFLLGRILVWSDPSFNDPGMIAKVESSFNVARGAQRELDCLIDLELGEMLLSAALAGKGDPGTLYRRALAALERAATSDVRAMRAEAVKTLVDAYVRRNAILRKAKASAKAS